MRRKKNKSQKIDIYRILMLPLMTMFLLNIGLIATTWAWYTASITSGRNTITAGAQVKVTVKNGDQPVQESNGVYKLEESKEYKVELQGGSAATGYVVLMDLKSTTTNETASILNVLFTPVYAEPVTDKYYVELGKEATTDLTIKTSSEKKTLTISTVWCEKTGGSISSSLIEGYSLANREIDLNTSTPTSYTINLLNENDTPLKQSEVMAGISTFSENTGEDQDAIITVEDTEETEITMPVIDGYKLVSVNGEEPKKSYLLVEGQENVFNAKYKKIAESTEQNPKVTSDNNEAEISDNKELTDENLKNQESNNVTVGGESANEEVTEQTDPVVESTEPIVGEQSTETAADPGQIQETPVEQKTANTVQEQPATVPQEQQQDESSESETVEDTPAAQSEVITTDDSTEVVDDVTDEIG